MSRNKPDYTKFMKKPPPLDPQPAPRNEAPIAAASQEIPWAEIVPIEHGEIAFTDPGETVRFERVDKPSQSPDRPAAESQPLQETASQVAPQSSHAPDPVAGSPRQSPAAPVRSVSPMQAPVLDFYQSTPPVPILTCGLFLVILAFLAC